MNAHPLDLTLPGAGWAQGADGDDVAVHQAHEELARGVNVDARDRMQIVVPGAVAAVRSDAVKGEVVKLPDGVVVVVAVAADKESVPLGSHETQCFAARATAAGWPAAQVVQSLPRFAQSRRSTPARSPGVARARTRLAAGPISSTCSTQPHGDPFAPKPVARRGGVGVTPFAREQWRAVSANSGPFRRWFVSGLGCGYSWRAVAVRRAGAGVS